MTDRTPQAASRLKKRYAAERRFRRYGVVAVSAGVFALFILLGSVFTSGYSAFQRTMIALEVNIDAELLGVGEARDKDSLLEADYFTAVRKAVYAAAPEISHRRQKKQVAALVSSGADLELRRLVIENPAVIGTEQRVYFSAASDFDQIHKGNAPRDIEEARRLLNDFQLQVYDRWVQEGRVSSIFNWEFFIVGDSRSAELAGIGGAVLGSIFTLFICLIISFPIAVAAAVYLEEFAPKNRWTELIEVNINNLAAVPSIIYGLLGLAIFLNFFELPRSTPIVGGVVLALRTLPIIIISCRSALKAVPPSIRTAALGVGASEMQVVVHHVLPLALPGTLTGTIIGLAQALGETAPLLMIGMVAFVADVPSGIGEPATVLPVQIYLWAESAERGFVEKTAAAIMTILAFLVCMNGLAVALRSRFERRW